MPDLCSSHCTQVASPVMRMGGLVGHCGRAGVDQLAGDACRQHHMHLKGIPSEGVMRMEGLLGRDSSMRAGPCCRRLLPPSQSRHHAVKTESHLRGLLAGL